MDDSFNTSRAWRSRFAVRLAGPCGYRQVAVGCAFLVLSLSAATWLNAASPQRNHGEHADGEVDLQSSRVIAHVYKTGLGHEHAVLGHLHSGRFDVTGSGAPSELVFDLRSFTADEPYARRYLGLEGQVAASTQEQVTENMRSDEVLDVRRYPTATFHITSITPLPGKSKRGLAHYEILGTFALHGRRKPVRVTADAEPKDGWLHVRGGFSMHLTDYGISPPRKALGAIGVADKLDIWADLWVAHSTP